MLCDHWANVRTISERHTQKHIQDHWKHRNSFTGLWAACAQVLNLELFDHDTFDPDDRLGVARLPVRDLSDGSEHDTWLDVDLAPVQDAEKEVSPYKNKCAAQCCNISYKLSGVWG